MVIEDALGSHNAESIAECEAMLRQALNLHDNNVSLCEDTAQFPWLNILARDGFAVLHYFPEEHDPGYISLGSMPDLDPNGTSFFALEAGGCEQEIGNRHVVSISAAVAAGTEFFASKRQPVSMTWFRL